MRLAVAAWLGASAAAGYEPLGDEWFDALVRYEEQADAVRYETNAARAMAAACLKLRPGGG